MQNKVKEVFNNDNEPIREFECVDLPGFTTMTENFKIAFEKALMSHEFAQNQNDFESLPVVFILTIKDPSEMRAFRLNNHIYSAYPDELEVILQAGFLCYVLRTEEIEYDEKTIQVVHLFSYG